MPCVLKRLCNRWVLATLLGNLVGGNAIFSYWTPGRDGASSGSFINIWFSIVAVGLLLLGFYRISPQRSEYNARGLAVVHTILVPVVSIGFMCMVATLRGGEIIPGLIMCPIVAVLASLFAIPLLFPLMLFNVVMFSMYHRRVLQEKGATPA